MADLRLLIVHSVTGIPRTYISTTCNALIGLEVFSLDPDTEKETGDATLDDGRSLRLTVLSFSLLLKLERAHDETGQANFRFSDYDAVLLLAGITQDLTVGNFSVAARILRKICGEVFLEERCIVVVVPKDKVDEVKEEGENPYTFLTWCKKQDGEFLSLLEEVQERCVLFDDNGSEEDLTSQRHVLVNMIDTRVFPGPKYIDRRFSDAEQRSQELEKQLAELREQFLKEIVDMRERHEYDRAQATKRAEEMENKFTQLKGEFREKTERLQEMEQELEDLKLQFEQ